ncbi:MAG: YegS/Rv2252/BmrU family lipid kinase [Ruminococcus sp.]|nr:YegS/Rv2252/BmrU family lipid kinase [Candidatus Copronaster equi]
MKHLFVINPAAGKGKGKEIAMSFIEKGIAGREIDYEIYVSKSSKDADEHIKKCIGENEKLRVYACGGDGTIFDIANSIYGYDNVEFAVVPLGSGNDFIRLFGTKEQFRDVGAQIDADAIEIDAIKCGDKIAVNQCSMGMDAEVCAKQSDFKKMPIFTGESAYTASLLYCLWTKRKNHFIITVDDGEPMEKDVVFAVAGNSRFYGGGYMAVPYAVPDDGLLDFSIIETMNIPLLLTRIGKYKKGLHYSWNETTYLRGKKINIKSVVPAAVNIDGECEIGTEKTFEIVPKAFKFVVPTTSTYIKDRESGIISDQIGK